MSLTREEALPAISREIFIGGETLTLRLCETGLMIWLKSENYSYPVAFPLSIGRDCEWGAFRQAVESMRAEAVERARIENAFQDLVDPIDGPDGEA